MTKLQGIFILELALWERAHIEINKDKRGWFTHYFIHNSGRKERIRNDTSKAIQRILKQKIKVKNHGKI